MSKWHSQTYGTLSFEELPDKIQLFYDMNKHYGEPIEITIGTDSQNHQETKVVTVISVLCKGHGGIFFYHIEYRPLVQSVKTKLEMETYISLETAQKLLANLNDKQVFPISIHIDAGTSPIGKTRDLIQSLTGWVHAMGYDCEIKPNSYAASSIADRISK